MLAGNAARMHGVSFSDPAQMANDLHVFSGEFVRSAILLLMINAAVLGTTAVSLSSSWAYGEVKELAAQPGNAHPQGSRLLSKPTCSASDWPLQSC